MNDPLATYLQDHLAGASHALELLEAMRKSHGEDQLGAFVGSLLVEIADDRRVLLELSAKAGVAESAIKEMGSWLNEKIARLKLGDGGGTTIETFEALEFLALGIHGKLALWNALVVLMPADARLRGPDYVRLVERALWQEASVERWRLDVAQMVLRPAVR